MEKYEIIILMNCHEGKESIRDTINNIFKFNKNCCIILNDGTKENLEDLRNHNVFVVKRKVAYDRFDTMVPLHLELKDCIIENNLKSEYVLLQSTNQLFIRQGFIDFIKGYKGSYYARKIEGNCISTLKRDSVFDKFHKDLNESSFQYQSNHDGMFFAYEDFMNMMNYFEDFRGKKLHFHAEEFLYVAYLIKNIGIEKLVEFGKYNYWQPNWRTAGTTPMKIDEIQKAKNENYFLVKRIARDINDEGRKHIREMI